MSQKMLQLEAALGPGFSPLNWNSLGIPDFIASCNKAINEFQSLVNQVQKNSSIIEKVIHNIANAKLVVEPPASEDIMDLQEFYEHIEKQRMQTVEHLVKKYRTISPLLGKVRVFNVHEPFVTCNLVTICIKYLFGTSPPVLVQGVGIKHHACCAVYYQVEESVCGTNTGKSKSMAEYYMFWERLIFHAITTMVLRAMANLQRMIENQTRPKMPSTQDSKRKPPLFKACTTDNSSTPELLPTARRLSQGHSSLIVLVHVRLIQKQKELWYPRSFVAGCV